MQRLIDADALRETLNNAQVEFDENYKGLGKAKSIIDDMPTIEAEPVVRCKDCKHHYMYKHRIMCARTAVKVCGEYRGLSAVRENHYCSYGAKMDEEQG